jgi:uncharacterized protein (DUF2249 family)
MPADGALTGTAAGLARQARLTLAAEHVLLLDQVAARAAEVRTAAAGGRWPAAELTALAGYARAEVLRQASDEEAFLFSAAPARRVAGLARDHARLRSAADALDRAAAGEQSMSPEQAATVARDFANQLERHLRAEETLLAAGRGVPGTAEFGGHPHEWYPLTEGPVVDLDLLPQDEAVGAALDRLLRMRRGERVELRSGTDPAPVWQELSELTPDGYRCTVLQDGPPRWRMRVTRRRAAG